MGKPTEDGLIEVSNARLRSKSLNVNWLMSIEDARQKVETWRRNYNKDRPQSALANLSPGNSLRPGLSLRPLLERGEAQGFATHHQD
jgi:transposase InsO family protein